MGGLCRKSNLATNRRSHAMLLRYQRYIRLGMGELSRTSLMRQRLGYAQIPQGSLHLRNTTFDLKRPYNWNLPEILSNQERPRNGRQIQQQSAHLPW